MTPSSPTSDRSGGRLRVARTRGALSGLLLVALGVWGALIPFVGPYFNFAFSPDEAWRWTSGRFWLEVLPGVAAIVAGLLLATTANRAVGVFAGYLGSAAGAWFIVGPLVGPRISSTGMTPGGPTGGATRQMWEQLGFFYGLGAVILFLSAQALGRFTVRSIRDIRASERHNDRPAADTTHSNGNHQQRENTYPGEPGPAGQQQPTRPPGARRM